MKTFCKNLLRRLQHHQFSNQSRYDTRTHKHPLQMSYLLFSDTKKPKGYSYTSLSFLSFLS